MKINVKGNYTWWSLAHLIAGMMIALLRYLWETELVTVLLIALVPLAVFRIWFDRGREPDERERQILLKTLSYSGITVLVLMSALNATVASYWVYALWTISLISRGGFGLLFFKQG